jgi:hypothetical protein
MFLVLSIASLGLVAAPSSAAVITETFDGTIAAGNPVIAGSPLMENIDYLGLFGPAGANLSGTPFTATYVADESTPGASAIFDVTSRFQLSELVGATLATVQIGSGSVSTTDPSQSSIFREIDPLDVGWVVDGGVKAPADFVGGVPRQFYTVINQLQSPTDAPPVPSYLYYEPFSHVTQPGDWHGGDTPGIDYFLVTGRSDNPLEWLSLSVSSVDVTVTGVVSPPPPPPPPPTVPEPDAWALMLAGFFGLGTVMRRRLRPASPPTAPG